MFRRNDLFFVAPVFLLLGISGGESRACENTTVRDAAYQSDRDVHRLCVIGDAGDARAGKIMDRLTAWLGESAPALNVVLVRVAADGPDVSWKDYGIPSAPPSPPVVVLAGYHTAERRAFFIDYWEPSPTAEDLAALRSSPAREAIRREVGKRLAVLLYMRGTGDAAGRAEPVLEATVRRWSEREPAGVSVVRVDRSDSRERLLRSFVGVQATGPDWVAVVFGRGKFLPPIQGEEITEAGLNERLELLVGACTCMRSPSTLGTDVPMVWEEHLDAAVVALRTPTNAEGLRSTTAPGIEASGSAFEGPVRAIALWTVGALVVVVMVVTAVMLRRKDRGGRAESGD